MKFSIETAVRFLLVQHIIIIKYFTVTHDKINLYIHINWVWVVGLIILTNLWWWPLGSWIRHWWYWWNIRVLMPVNDNGNRWVGITLCHWQQCSCFILQERKYQETEDLHSECCISNNIATSDTLITLSWHQTFLLPTYVEWLFISYHQANEFTLYACIKFNSVTVWQRVYMSRSWEIK